jgi:hypothetical protein
MSVATKTKVDLDQLRSREAELTEQVEAKRAQLSEYPAKIAEANLDAVYAGKRPLAQLNSPLQKLRDAEKKDVTTLVNLEGELSAVRSVIAVEAARVAEEETAEAREQTAELHAKEEAIWRQAAELLGELAGAWNAYVTLAEEEDKFASLNRLEGPGVLAVEPAPLTFRSFLLLLLAASTDADVRAEPFTEQLADIGAFGRRDEQGNDIGGAVYEVRPAGTRQVETRRKLDYGDRLYHVVPDLRSIVHKLQLSGRVPTIAE